MTGSSSILGAEAARAESGDLHPIPITVEGKWRLNVYPARWQGCLKHFSRRLRWLPRLDEILFPLFFLLFFLQKFLFGYFGD